MINKIRKKKKFELRVGMKFQYVDQNTNTPEKIVYTIDSIHKNMVKITWNNNISGSASSEYERTNVIKYFYVGVWRLTK